MAKRLYVGNLNYQTTDDGLREVLIGNGGHDAIMAQDGP